MKSHNKSKSHDDTNNNVVQAVHTDEVTAAGQPALGPVQAPQSAPEPHADGKPALVEAKAAGAKPVLVEIPEPKPVLIEIQTATPKPKPVLIEIQEPKPVLIEIEEPKPVLIEVVDEAAGQGGQATESNSDTAEQILEAHGLTSSAQITEEIAEEIMAVHAVHDEDEKVVVAVDGLYKKYSKKADWAVANVNFHCYEGEIVGLLGHNGAGKSTTIKCLEGMLPFDEGTISIFGHDIVKDPISAKANMGFVTDNHAVFVKMTGMQYLAFMADVYKVPTDVRKQRVEELEEVFQLGPAINNLISSYSHGMRQKICMMGSLIHHPKLWVLDEPMTGLDPRTMHSVQVFMRNYADAGNCIIFSSHALITVAKMCDRVVLLHTGCQLDELNIKRIMTVDPTFDFEEYFLKHERQD